MPAVKALNIIALSLSLLLLAPHLGVAQRNDAVSFVGYLLAAPHLAVAQRRDDVTALIQQVIQLTQQRHFSEAIALAQRVLAIQETRFGADNPAVAEALYRLAWLYRAKIDTAKLKLCTNDHWRYSKERPEIQIFVRW
jgi:hypothetical protein